MAGNKFRNPYSGKPIHQSASLASALLFVVVVLIALPASVFAQTSAGEDGAVQRTVLGVRNLPLKQGAEELLAGHWEEGVLLTHRGLEQAFGNQEHEAALSNLCAGYLQMQQYDTALMYCEMLLARNSESWRGYNNRALIYIKTKQWDKAEADLIAGEAINSGAYTLKVARSMYMDAVHPVAPEIEVDDTNATKSDDAKDN